MTQRSPWGGFSEVFMWWQMCLQDGVTDWSIKGANGQDASLSWATVSWCIEFLFHTCFIGLVNINPSKNTNSVYVCLYNNSAYIILVIAFGRWSGGLCQQTKTCLWQKFTHVLTWPQNKHTHRHIVYWNYQTISTSPSRTSQWHRA